MTGVARLPASQETFSWQKDPASPPVTITVQKYYQEHYKINLRHPDLHCLLLGGGARRASVPPELCHVIGCQRVPRQSMGVENEAAMILNSAVPPRDRHGEIVSAVQALSSRPEGMFGMRLGTRLLDVQGRILPPPSLSYKNGDYSVAKGDGPVFLNGGWNMTKKQFVEAKPLNKWVFLNCTRTPIREDPRFQVRQRQKGKGIVLICSPCVCA